MKAKFSVTFDIDDDLNEVEAKQTIEDKRRYLEDDIRVRFHNDNLKVKVKIK